MRFNKVETEQSKQFSASGRLLSLCLEDGKFPSEKKTIYIDIFIVPCYELKENFRYVIFYVELVLFEFNRQ